MKNFTFLCVFLFCSLVFGFVIAKPAQAQLAIPIIYCSPPLSPIGEMRVGCPCTPALATLCASDICIAPPGTGLGLCGYPAQDKDNPFLRFFIQPVSGPPPAPPCSQFANGSCAKVHTALGDVSTEPGAFIGRVAGILIAAAGSIAVLLIIRAGYRIMTSRGNPEALQQGREQFIAAVVGLLFIIFSFVILEVIGVDLLRIPGSEPTSGLPGGAAGGAGAGAGVKPETCFCIKSGQAGTCRGEGGHTRAGGNCGSGNVLCCIQ